MSHTIESILSNLNSSYSKVTQNIPSKFNFSDEPSYFSITTQDYDYLGGAYTVFLQSNGKVLVAGDSGLVDQGENYTLISRFNSDGSLDVSFNRIKFYGFVYSLGEQSDGKIIVGGEFQVENSNQSCVARLNADGSFDGSFTPNVGDYLNSSTNVVKVLSDDSILLGGYNLYNGEASVYLEKLNADGSYNSSFNSNVSINGQVYAMCVDADHKIYVGGDFSNCIARLNADGSIDETFDIGLGFDYPVSSIELDNNGKVIVGGFFYHYNTSWCNPCIVRLNTNGSLDGSFTTQDPGIQFMSGPVAVISVAVQSDNKVVAAGWFYGYNNTKVGRIIRFNTDGTQDTTFESGTGFDDVVFSILVDGNNNIFCAGNFFNYNGKNCTQQFNYANSEVAGFCVKLNPHGVLIGTPLKHNFVATGINDGGNDMWDGGNYYNTNLTNTYDSGQISDQTSIPFTHSTILVADSSNLDDKVYDISTDTYNYNFCPKDGSIVPGNAYFGDGSSYFTNMYPGLLVLAATNININEFSITGGTGQDGIGYANHGSMDVIVDNDPYALFYKYTYNSEDSGIHQVIIVPGTTSGITQDLYDLTENDDHVLTGLSDRKEIYVITFARLDSGETTEDQIRQVAISFIKLFNITPITSCQSQLCTTTAYKCLVKSSNSCTCTKLNYINKAYVPAITVCNQRLF